MGDRGSEADARTGRTAAHHRHDEHGEDDADQYRTHAAEAIEEEEEHLSFIGKAPAAVDMVVELSGAELDRVSLLLPEHGGEP